MCYSEDHVLSTNQTRPDGFVQARFASPMHRALKMSAYSQVQSSAPSLRNASFAFVEFTAGIILSFGTVLFAIWFPYILTPDAASKTYIPAFYQYDPELSHFDNTAWTYGTDYFLTVAMTLLAHACLTASTSKETLALRIRAACLFVCYAISVTAGGWAHQHYTTLESRDGLRFRVIWTICVGTVTAAGGFMGSCASEVSEKFASHVVPKVPEAVWVGFGVGTTLVCALGGLSYQRPACDIFVAGTSQTPPTFFLMGVVVCSMIRKLDCPIRPAVKLMCLAGFILNAPLLPMYSVLIQYTDWSLAAVNTLLHSWLLVSWSMQGLSLRHFVQAVDRKNNSKKD